MYTNINKHTLAVVPYSWYQNDAITSYLLLNLYIWLWKVGARCEQRCGKLLLCISTFYIYAALPQRRQFHEELMRCLAAFVAQWEKEGKSDKKQMRERFSAKWSAVGLPSTAVFLMVWRNALILSLSSTATLRSLHVLPFLHPFYPFLI